MHYATGVNYQELGITKAQCLKIKQKKSQHLNFCSKSEQNRQNYNCMQILNLNNSGQL